MTSGPRSEPPAVRRADLLPRLLLGLSALVGLYFSLGFVQHAPLLWIAPVPLLLLAFELRWTAAACSTFIICYLALTNIFVAAGYTLESQNLAVYLGYGVDLENYYQPAVWYALTVTILVLATRATLEQRPDWTSLWVYPLGWVAFEYLSAQVRGGDAVSSLAGTQLYFLPLVQLVSVTGVWGVTLLLTAVPAGIAGVWHFRYQPRQAALALLVPLSLLTLVLVFGAWRLSREPSSKQIAVGIAAAADVFESVEARSDGRPETPQSGVALDEYARLVAQLAAAGAEVVLLREKCVPATSATQAEVRERIAQLARSAEVTVIIGVEQHGDPGPPRTPGRNEALVYAPGGQLLVDYAKVHMIRGLEDEFAPGADPGLVPSTDPRWGVAICKDLDFPSWQRTYSREGVGILFVPALDFGEDGWLHARSAVLRGIEGGFAVVRAGGQGLLTASDGRGRILAQTTTSPRGPVMVLVHVEPGSGSTFYAWTGDWLAWFSIAGLMVLLARAFRQYLPRWRRTGGNELVVRSPNP